MEELAQAAKAEIEGHATKISEARTAFVERNGVEKLCITVANGSIKAEGEGPVGFVSESRVGELVDPFVKRCLSLRPTKGKHELVWRRSPDFSKVEGAGGGYYLSARLVWF